MKTQTKVCPRPFYHCEITICGDVYMCCPAYCRNYKIGNLHRASLEQIWHGKAAQDFRSRMLAGDWSSCDMRLCFQDKFDTETVIRDSYYKDGALKLPGMFVLSYDTECNLACALCRKKIIRNSDEDLKNYNAIEDSFMPYMKDCRIVYMNGAGDPFGSAYSRSFISRVVKEWPHIRFQFLTNGQMLTPALFFNLSLDRRVECLQVSIHAATANVYRHIARSDKFANLLKNLAFFSELKKDGGIGQLAFTFVVCRENYKDMPAFAALAEKHGATCSFSTYQDWKREPFSKSYAEHAVFNRAHPEFADFMKILRHTNLDKPVCRFNGLLRSLRLEARGAAKPHEASCGSGHSGTATRALRRLNFNDLMFIPLGYTPFPASFLNQTGIKEIHNASPAALPFDYAYHPVEAILKYLDNGFCGYEDGLYYDEIKGHWLQSCDSISFNHDRDCGPDDLEKLKARIRSRIDNLRKLLHCPDPCVFVFSSYDVDSPKDVIDAVLMSAKNLRRGKPFIFLALGSSSLGEIDLPLEVIPIVEDFPCARMDDWWNIDSRQSLSGLQFTANLELKLRTALGAMAILKHTGSAGRC